MNFFAWTLSAVTMSFAVFGQHRYQQLINSQSTAFELGLFTALTRVAWPIAICYIIFACARDFGGPVNWFLSLPIWQPFARLSYAFFLFHFPIIQIAASSDSPPIFDEFKAFQLFIAVSALTILVAVPATLAFDSPLDTIGKMIFASKERTTISMTKKMKQKIMLKYRSV